MDQLIVNTERHHVMEKFECNRYYIPSSFHQAILSSIECAHLSELVMLNDLLNSFYLAKSGDVTKQFKRFQSSCKPESVLPTILESILITVSAWSTDEEEDQFLQSQLGRG